MRIRKEQIKGTAIRTLINITTNQIVEKSNGELLTSHTLSFINCDIDTSYNGIIRFDYNFKTGTNYSSRLGFQLGSGVVYEIYLPLNSGLDASEDYEIFLEYNLGFFGGGYIDREYVFTGRLIYKRNDIVLYKQFTSNVIRTTNINIEANRVFTIKFNSNNNSKLKVYKLTLEKKDQYNIL